MNQDWVSQATNKAGPDIIGGPEAAPPRATHVCGLMGYNPMLGDQCPACDTSRVAEIRTHVNHSPHLDVLTLAADCRDLLREYDRLRASLAPSRESGALLDEYAEASRLHGEFRAVGADGFAAEHATLADAARRKLDARLSTLERDATRMREAAVEGFAAHLATFGTVIQREKESSIARAYLAALAPSGEPTTQDNTNPKEK